MKKLISLVSILFLLPLLLTAQDKSYKKDPGYVDFGSFIGLDTGESVTEVQLEAPILRMVAKMSQGEDEDLSSLLEGLKLIKVFAFDVTSKTRKRFLQKVKETDARLMKKGWQRIVRVRDKGDYSNIYIRTAGDSNISGLVVTAVEDSGDAAFVNIVGKINLETIGRLTEKFNIPELNKIDKNENNNSKDNK